MKPSPILSVLICGTPRRAVSHAIPLVEKLIAQAGEMPVEVLYLLDNKKRSVGGKRQALLDIARGDYIAFCDDDDDVMPNYCARLVEAAMARPDVITFDQSVDIDGQKGVVHCRLGQDNFPFVPGGITLRNAWHFCGWRRDLATCCRFPDIMDGEDWGWARVACSIAKTEVHIPEILHVYRFSRATTEATGKNTPQP